ncbi:MAG: hypothetical protein QOF44_2716, partial [Streptomyces sp.]|nr:hypothetical protein [Streptomyces sp.]
RYMRRRFEPGRRSYDGTCPAGRCEARPVFAVALSNGELGDTATLTTVPGFGLSVTGPAVNLLRATTPGAAYQFRHARLQERLAADQRMDVAGGRARPSLP